MNTQKNYELAREIYAGIGVDTDAALEKLQKTPISIHCWQGDDVNGFLFQDIALSGGIQTTGNYPGRARNVAELRQDLDFALRMIPSRHRLNLHAIYADTDEKVDLTDLEPRHFASWVQWAKERGMGLDYNPTCFSHPMADSGFTISSADPAVRAFWIEHCRKSRRISEYFGRELGTKCVTNFWFPDGYKDIPADTLVLRESMTQALDEIFAAKFDPKYTVDALESKLFGLGVESYTVASHEFSLLYAATRNILYTLDAGHFHPTESIAAKLTAILNFLPQVMLHVSRGVRWDSDHVVIWNDELQAIATEIIHNGYQGRVNIGLDYFDASINRIACWIIGVRDTRKALLKAALDPMAPILKAEQEGDYTSRLALLEESKTLPFADVWDYYCMSRNVPVGQSWLKTVKEYEAAVTLKR